MSTKKKKCGNQIDKTISIINLIAAILNIVAMVLALSRLSRGRGDPRKRFPLPVLNISHSALIVK